MKYKKERFEKFDEKGLSVHDLPKSVVTLFIETFNTFESEAILSSIFTVWFDWVILFSYKKLLWCQKVNNKNNKKEK